MVQCLQVPDTECFEIKKGFMCSTNIDIMQDYMQIVYLILCY